MDTLRRVASFAACARNDISFLNLARDGFSYINQTIKCKECNVQLTEDKLHTKSFKLFHGIQCTLPESMVEIPQLNRLEPDFNLLQTESSRMETFHDWPCESPIKPKDLAECGLFYSGEQDKVQCAYCRGYLKWWEPNDIAIDEHIKHFPKCAFVRKIWFNKQEQLKRTTPLSNVEILEEENQQLKDMKTCKICLDNISDTVFLPCGHLITCGTCSVKVSQCPTCRGTIQGTIKVFM